MASDRYSAAIQLFFLLRLPSFLDLCSSWGSPFSEDWTLSGWQQMDLAVSRCAILVRFKPRALPRLLAGLIARRYFSQRTAGPYSFDEGSELCRPPTSASPQKLTSGPNEELVAIGQQPTWECLSASANFLGYKRRKGERRPGGVTPSTATRERMAAPAPISITTLRRSCRSARRDFTVSAGVSQSRLTVASAFAWFARAPYTAKTRPRGCAENRRAAALGGLKLASAVTTPPALFAWPQKPLILLGRKRYSSPIEHGAR